MPFTFPSIAHILNNLASSHVLTITFRNRGRLTLGDISSFKSATIKYGVLWQEGKNGRFYEAKVALDFDL